MSAVDYEPERSERFPKRSRSVTRLLQAAFDAINQKGLIDALYAVQLKSKVSDNVLAEGFAALSRAARDLSGSRRLTPADIEDSFPNHIRSLFIRACEICERKTPQGDLP